MKTVILIVLLCVALPAQIVKTGDLYELVDSLKQAMPIRNSMLYVIPTDAERDSFNVILDFIIAEDFANAATKAANVGYELLDYTDTENNSQRYYILKEDSSQHEEKAQWKGWGTYMFRDAASVSAAVEIPHPINDTNSWRVGFESYRGNNSKYLLMAGTHRYANGNGIDEADVAHDTLNIFHLVHKKIAALSTKTVQIHGFKQSNYVAPLPDVIVSNGTSKGSTDAVHMRDAVIMVGYDAGVYDFDTIPHLGATQNKQGIWSRANELSFVHVEIDSFIRFNSSNRATLLPGIVNGLDIEDPPLPVRMLEPLQAKRVAGGYKLTAKTASESNSSKIALQRRVNQLTWRTIEEISSENTHEFGRVLDFKTDYFPIQGVEYLEYRLISVEHDGHILEDIEGGYISVLFDAKPETKTSLLQSSPNPFRVQTTIRYIVEKPATYSLYIYNILGQRVRTLVESKPHNTSVQQFAWNGKNNTGKRVAAGVYFYQLVNHNTGEADVKKMYILH